MSDAFWQKFDEADAKFNRNMKVALGAIVILGAAGGIYLATRPSNAAQTSGSNAPSLPGGSPSSGSSHSPTAPRPNVPDDIEFGEIAFPPVQTGPQWERLQHLAARAEEVTGMTGLYSYLLATAERESKGVPTAMNTQTDGAPALRLFCRDQNYNGRFKDNPWRPEVCDASDPLAARWAYSGGWFQTMTATALATADKRAHTHDPARVFDPPFSVAHAADLVFRLGRGYGAQTWGDIRAGWALPKWSRPDSTASGKTKVLERFEWSLEKVASMGADPDLAGKPVDTSRYPGFTATLHHLLQADGRTGVIPA